MELEAGPEVNLVHGISVESQMRWWCPPCTELQPTSVWGSWEETTYPWAVFHIWKTFGQKGHLWLWSYSAVPTGAAMFFSALPISLFCCVLGLKLSFANKTIYLSLFFVLLLQKAGGRGKESKWEHRRLKGGAWPWVPELGHFRRCGGMKSECMRRMMWVCYYVHACAVCIPCVMLYHMTCYSLGMLCVVCDVPCAVLYALSAVCAVCQVCLTCCVFYFLCVVCHAVLHIMCDILYCHVMCIMRDVLCGIRCVVCARSAHSACFPP